ncbi:hypothetical protein WJX72_008486 [[Myrmecia] bisecta]|uniref:Ras-related protein Rab-21 n=1 Tax=[Myrmecia] bisecta TaxID=41462 RepID=A0AAW1P5T8_9CHLO
MPPVVQHTFKVVVLGEGHAGKTSLVVRYVQGTFNDARKATVQASFLTKHLDIDGSQVELAIWDTAGQERYHSLAPIYFRDAHAALIVFDITDADSFTRAKSWVKELRTMVGPGILLAIAANKQDLDRDRTVPDADSKAYAQSIGASHLQTSAKTGLGLEEAFEEMAARVLQQHNAAAATQQQAAKYLPGRRQGTMRLADEATRPPPKRSACC